MSTTGHYLLLTTFSLHYLSLTKPPICFLVSGSWWRIQTREQPRLMSYLYSSPANGYVCRYQTEGDASRPEPRENALHDVRERLFQQSGGTGNAVVQTWP